MDEEATGFHSFYVVQHLRLSLSRIGTDRPQFELGTLLQGCKGRLCIKI